MRPPKPNLTTLKEAMPKIFLVEVIPYTRVYDHVLTPSVIVKTVSVCTLPQGLLKTSDRLFIKFSVFILMKPAL